MTDCATLVAKGWEDHADRPGEVAARLAASLSSIATSDDAIAVARLAAHVYGEHLGRWNDGIALIEAIGAQAVSAGEAPAGALRRHVATLRFAGGDETAVDGLGRDDRVAVLASAASTLAGQKSMKAAVAAYTGALALAAQGLADGSPAVRALAAGGHNLACALEEHGARDAEDTRGMVMAAEASLRYWKQAGTWLETERAEYRLAKSLLQAGRAGDAVEAARRCLAVCERHDAPAFERLFAWAVVAAAERAAGANDAADAARSRCLALFEALPADERGACEAEIRAL